MTNSLYRFVIYDVSAAKAANCDLMPWIMILDQETCGWLSQSRLISLEIDINSTFFGFYLIIIAYVVATMHSLSR